MTGGGALEGSFWLGAGADPPWGLFWPTGPLLLVSGGAPSPGFTSCSRFGSFNEPAALPFPGCGAGVAGIVLLGALGTCWPSCAYICDPANQSRQAKNVTPNLTETHSESRAKLFLKSVKIT